MIAVHVSAVCRVRDGYTGRALEAGALLCALDGAPFRPVGKPGGYLILVDLAPGPHRLSLRGSGFQEEWVDLEAVTVSTIDTAWTGNAGTGNSGQTASQTTQQYTVVAGDMLSVICRRTYGNGSAKYYEALAAYNGIANPHLIHPGDVLQLPPEDQLFGR